MDVDDRAAYFIHKVIGKYLHVARHDDELGNVLLHDLELRSFRLSFVVFAYRNVVEGQSVAFGILCQRFVIGNNAGEFTSHFTRTEAENSVVEAVVSFRDEQRDLWAISRLCDFGPHAKLFRGELFKTGGFLVNLARGNPFHTLKENARLGIFMLIGVDDITTTQKNPAGYA